MKNLLCSLIFLGAFSFAAFADIAPPPTPRQTATPKQSKTIDSRMTIRFDQNATDAKLIIPKSKIKQLRAELEMLDDESNTNAVLDDSSGGFPRAQAVIGGLFLSLAFVFGGVWVVRNRKSESKTNKAVGGLILLFLVGSAATIAFANAGPPSALRNISSKLFDKKVFGYWKRADGNIKIEVSADRDGFELIIPDKDEKAKPNEE